MSNLNEAAIKPAASTTPSPPAGGGVTGSGAPTDRLPTTLSYLVLFWDELCKYTLHKISQKQLINRGPIPPAAGEPGESSGSVVAKLKKKEERGKLAAKKARDGAKLMGALRGNLFGAAADELVGKLGGPGAANRLAAVLCELCGDEFPHPVTYHMRQAHPGCGRPAGGQGYNSGGNFCGGWAGSCGDGGVGGSTWYLMCDMCRTKCLREKKKLRPGPRDRARKAVTSSARSSVTSSTVRKKAATPVTSSSNPSAASTEPHWILHSNAMFVLELAARSAYHTSMSRATSQPVGMAAALSAVSEDASASSCLTAAFAPVPFLYLQLHGACSEDSVFSDDVDDDVRYFHRAGNSAHHQVGGRGGRGGCELLDRSVSDSSRHHGARPVYQGHEDGTDRDELVGARTVFQRSVSEMGAIGHAGSGAAIDAGLGLQHDNGLSLVKRPSTEMSRLIQSLDGVDRVGDHISRLAVMSFLTEWHDLDVLRRVLVQAARRAACRTYALDALNWLLRSISQTSCLHDLLWHLVTSLSCPGALASAADEDEPATTEPAQDPDQDVAVCFHPASDVSVAGEMTTKPLVSAFHTLLQSVADVLMHVPPGGAVQRMAVRCWSIQFEPSDHAFLHRSHVFSHISRILSSADELGTRDATEIHDTASSVRIEHLDDLTGQADIKASSRQAMVAGLTDHSTETFWESGDEDKNKTKTLSVSLGPGAVCHPRVISVHVDNARDIGNKVSAVTMSAGLSADVLQPVRTAEIDQRHVGWVSAWLTDPATRQVRIELRGPDNTLRVRQLKLLGAAKPADGGGGVMDVSGDLVAQRECENETLSVFRLLTSLVFGRLVSEEGPAGESGDRQCHDVDLKEHMVGILFSHSSELTKLQRQVCAHIVNSIHLESARVRSLWQSDAAGAGPVSDAYCFELLSLLLALSGSSVGRRYVAQQNCLIEDLVSLLHTASPRVQRQVVSLLRRVLADIAPRSFAAVLGIDSLPPADLGSLVRTSAISETPCRGLLDVFLACIAKALTVNVKSRLPGVKSRSTSSTCLADCLPPAGTSSEFWWLRGSVPGQLAESIIQLLMEMAGGQMGSEWQAVTKSAVAGPIVSLSRLAAASRTVDACMQSSVMWLALGALCVLSDDHVEQLSTGRFAATSPAAGCPTCVNHDDGETPATIVCASGCGSLCSECDRVLHLSRRCRSHHRQVLKEEEESIRVDLHEGCGRVKLYWLLALADAKTLKAVVELRQVTGTPNRQHTAALPSSTAAASVSQDTCRFCGSPAASTPLDVVLPGAVCSQSECIEYGHGACTKTLGCGHLCAGVRNETPCLPCLYGCLQEGTGIKLLRQDADDMCMICFADALSAAPVILLDCGHAFHSHCCRQAVDRRWPGPRITFTFLLCPICKQDMAHASLELLIAPARALRDDVRRKALMRLEYEGLARNPQTPAAPDSGGGSVGSADLVAYAMDRYAYYVCHKCKKAYYGGEARCELAVDSSRQAAVDAVTDDYDPSELVCGACSDVTRAQMCVRHGADFLEYKCRYCCSVAVFFCFGTTHFCGPCHDDFQRVTAMSRSELPRCPAGPRATQLSGDECPLHVQHPATGEEFALGCGVCRNAHTF